MYDLIVIGGGPGGYVAAIRACQLGLKTALVEQDKLGGTCLNRGCVPTKSLLHAADLYRQAQGFSALGLEVSGLDYDFSGLHTHKNRVVETLRGGVEQLLKANKIEVLPGRGMIKSAGQVEVNGQVYESKKILIATGSVPALPPIPGSDLPQVVSSNQLLEQEGRFFPSLAIIGGGVIGVEMASIYASLGCRVIIVEALERLLPMMDKEIGQNLSMILKKRGVEVLTAAQVSGIEAAGDEVNCLIRHKDVEKQLQVAGVLIATGRKPYTEGLLASGLDITIERGFITVDAAFQTSVAGIYAIGDVIGGMQLAHAAEAQGIAAVEQLAGLAPTVNTAVIPSCVYTSPEIACVGLTAEQAAAQGMAVRTGKYVMSGNAKSMIEGEERGFVKLVFEQETEKMIGAQLMCGRATDLIGELVTAISAGLTLAQVTAVVHPHPTFCEGIQEAYEAVNGHSIHTMPRR